MTFEVSNTVDAAYCYHRLMLSAIYCYQNTKTKTKSYIGHSIFFRLMLSTRRLLLSTFSTQVVKIVLFETSFLLSERSSVSHAVLNVPYTSLTPPTTLSPIKEAQTLSTTVQ